MNTNETRQWTRHNHDLPEAGHQIADQVIGSACATVADIARQADLTSSVLLGGSLARSEAALRQSGDDWTLRSDFDFVVIGPDEQRLRADCVIEAARSEHPNLDLTHFHVDARDAGRVRSFFGSDLRAGAGLPVHTGRYHINLGHHTPKLRARLEVIAHQASNRLLYPVLYRDATSARVQASTLDNKLLLEALRVVVRRPESRLVDAIEGAEILGLPTALARAALRERNIGDGAVQATPCDLSVVVGRSVGMLLGDQSSDWASTLIARLNTGPFIMDAFQLLVLALTGAPIHDLPSVAQALGVMRSRALEPEPDDLRDALDSLCASLALGATAREPSVLSSLIVLRSHYYRALGPHNFGSRPIMGYEDIDKPLDSSL